MNLQKIKMTSGRILAALRRLQTVKQHFSSLVQPVHVGSSRVNLSVSPKHAMIDEKVRIVAQGLQPGQKVTLQAFMIESERSYGSCGHFEADTNGAIDISKHSSCGGSYLGLDQMGLFWSMQRKPGEQRRRLFKADVMTPYDVTICLHDGFHNLEDLPWSDVQGDSCLQCTHLFRYYARPGVKRVPVEENGLYGVFFFPKGDGPFPAVIDMFGFTSEILEFRSALLASHGFASFVITYVGRKGLPKDLSDLIDFQYFLKAFDFLADHPLVDRNALGGVATCGGAAFLQVLAGKRPQMKCYISVNGALFTLYKTETVEGETIEGRMGDLSRATFSDDGCMILKTIYVPEIDGALSFPGWRNGAKALYIQALDDQSVNPELVKFLESSVSGEERKQMTFLYYPGAGHLLEPPFSPHSASNYNPIFKCNLLWGGEPVLHAKAQEDSWPKILQFLHQHLK